VVADAKIDELERTLRDDSGFRQRFDDDPVAATRERGWTDIASEFERYIADREAFKAEVEQFDGDVEAHGLRESGKARLIAVFVTSAAVAAWAAPMAAASGRWG